MGLGVKSCSAMSGALYCGSRSPQSCQHYGPSAVCCMRALMLLIHRSNQTWNLCKVIMGFLQTVTTTITGLSPHTSAIHAVLKHNTMPHTLPLPHHRAHAYVWRTYAKLTLKTDDCTLTLCHLNRNPSSRLAQTTTVCCCAKQATTQTH